jgi:hypothetical protein
VIALAEGGGAVEILERRRIALTDPETAGANQPYHFVEEWNLPRAETYLAGCSANSERPASKGLGSVLADLQRRRYEVSGGAIVLASGRPLPELAQILASHALIHTAEGEFFRRACWRACEGLGIAVTGIRERDLEGQVDAATRQEVSGLGRIIGPPWTAERSK